MTRFTDEQIAQKRAIYESLGARSRKFIDRIGFDKWDPFQLPNDPIDIRLDPTRRTTQQLVTEFLRSRSADKGYSQVYASGAMECALGLLQRQDRFIGMFEFSVWYNDLMQREGVSYDHE